MTITAPKTTPHDYGFKAGDYHLIVHAGTNLATMYDTKGTKLWEKPCLPTGQRADWTAHGGDTPPGVYKIGAVWRQYQDPPSHYDRPYGHICFDLIDYEGNEDSNGRGGIAIHGGGTGLPGTGYWDDYQKLLPTLGCVRMHNKDLYLIDNCLSQGDVWVSVYQDDK